MVVRLNGVQEVAGSNPAGPMVSYIGGRKTRFIASHEFLDDTEVVPPVIAAVGLSQYRPRLC